MDHGRIVPLVLLAAAASLPAGFACGGSGKKVVDVNAGFGGADAGQASFAAPPPPPPSVAPMGSVYTTDPNALAQLLAAAAAAGSAWFAPMGADDPVEIGIRAAAAKVAPGMSPEGEMAKGVVQEDGHVDFLVHMDPSRCYTIVAYGQGVQDLDLNLLVPPLYTTLSAQDGMTGPTAVIGAAPKPLCPVLPFTIPYKVDMHAKKGGGSVGAQVYSKPK